jgi:hypothetical protein
MFQSIIIRLKNYLPENYNDESKLSFLFDIDMLVIPISLGLIGILVCFFSLFSIRDFQERIEFSLFGAMGSFFGFISWNYCLGQLIFP